MKQALNTTYTFNPSTQTVNLSGIANFNINQLYAIIDVTASTVIYAVGQAGLGYTALAGSTITLAYATAALNAADSLMIIYDTPDNSITGTITGASQSITIPVKGAATVSADISGTWAGTLSLQYSSNGTTWYSEEAQSQSLGTLITSTTSNDNLIINCGGYNQIRVTSTAWTSGTATITLNAGEGENLTQVYNLNAANLLAKAQLQDNNGAGMVFTTKNTQQTNALPTQDIKDSGRNMSNLFMVSQVVSTATDTLMSLTGYKSGAAVSATTTPAVVTTGKTYRITAISMTYIAVSTVGTIRFTLRANTGGVVAITSPAAAEWSIGEYSTSGTPAGIANTITVPFPDGLEFPAGTGLGVSMQGFGATGTAAAVGYGMISIYGYEY